jgi:tetratricopeptide (TPR) repeat protein
MMINNKKSRISCSFEPEGYILFSFRHYFCIFCLIFVPSCFWGSLVGAEISSKQSGTKKIQESVLSSSDVSKDLNSKVRRRLLRAEIDVITSTKDKATKEELQRIIKQIRSITFQANKRSLEPEPVEAPKAVPISEPNEMISDTAEQKEQEEKEEQKIENKLPYQPVTDETLQTLVKLSLHPEGLDNPFELGETLFLSGNLKEAVVFYREALRRIGSDDTRTNRDKAWILFQIGNCLWNDDPSTAMKVYGRLIAEHPNSPWKDFAEARSKILGWYQTEEPQKLIEKREP